MQPGSNLDPVGSIVVSINGNCWLFTDIFQNTDFKTQISKPQISKPQITLQKPV